MNVPLQWRTTQNAFSNYVQRGKKCRQNLMRLTYSIEFSKLVHLICKNTINFSVPQILLTLNRNFWTFFSLQLFIICWNCRNVLIELNLCLLLAGNEFQELKVNFLSSFSKLFFISIWSIYQLYISIIILMFCFTSLIQGLFYIEQN